MIELNMPSACIDKHKRFIFEYKANTSSFTFKERLENRVKELKNDTFVCEYLDGKSKKTCFCRLTITEQKKYIKVFEYIILNLEEIVIGNIDKLKKHIGYLDNKISKLKVDTSRKLNSDLGEYFTEVYNSFINRVSLERTKVYWGAYEYVNSLGVSVCTYCNSQFTFIIEKTGNTRPDLDHFHSQRKYPYLAISLFNLIPCCKICNSSFKGQKETSYEKNYSPFESGIVDNMEFVREVNLNTKDYVQAILGVEKDFSLKLKINDSASTEIKNKIIGNIDLFKLEKVYDFHKLYVQKLILQFSIYNDVYKEQLLQAHPKLFSSESEMQKVLAPLPNDFKTTILGKLTYDIIMQELND